MYSSLALIVFTLVLGSMCMAGEPELSLPGMGEVKDVEFKAKVDGTAQRYVEALPEKYKKKNKYDLVIALHGHGSDRWQYIKQTRGECKAVRDLAAKHGMIMVSPDYRAATSWMGPKAEADMVQIIKEICSKRKIKRIFLVGASMGGTSVLIFTALHPELVDGVMSQNGTANMVEYTNFTKAIEASYGGSKKEKLKEYKKRSAELAPKQFKKIPIAITTGGKDTSVPPTSTLRLAEVLKKQDKKNVLLIHRENTGHSTSYNDTMKAFTFVIELAKENKKKQKERARKK